MTLAEVVVLVVAGLLGGLTVDAVGRNSGPTWLSWGLGWIVAMLLWILLPQVIH